LKDDPNGLIEILAKYEKEYKGNSDKGSYFYRLRNDYNHLQDQSRLYKAARFIALNKTGYNGMYRENQKGEFNVPWGKYDNPTICDSDNLRKVSIALNYSDTSITAYDYKTALLSESA
jgi:DNA adenine methylase